MSKSSQKEKSTSAKPNQPVRTFFPLGPDFSLNDKPQTIRAVQASESQGQRYTAEEIEVLRQVEDKFLPKCYHSCSHPLCILCSRLKQLKLINT